MNIPLLIFIQNLIILYEYGVVFNFYTKLKKTEIKNNYK